MILDSSFLIDVEIGNERAIARARQIDESDLPQRIPLIVVSELYVSVGKGVQSEENRAAVDAVLDSRHLVPASEPIAKRAGLIEGEIQQQGSDSNGVGIADATIAATALEYDEPIVTDDADYWTRVPRDIDVRTY